MAASVPLKYLFNAEERALMQPFKQEYLSVATSAERKNIAITKIFPSVVGKWKLDMAPEDEIDMERALRVCQKLHSNWY